MAQEIVVKIVADVSDLQNTIDIVEKLGEVEKGVADAFRTATAASKAQQEQLKAVGSSTQQASNDVAKLAVNVKNAGQSIVNAGIDKAFNQVGVAINSLNTDNLDKELLSAKTNLQSLIIEEKKLIDIQAQTTQPKILEQLEKELTRVRADIETTKKSITDIKSLLAQSTGSGGFEEVGNEIEQTITKSKSLVTQLRQMKQDLVLLQSQGKGNTDEFKALQLQAAKLEDAIGDVSLRVRNLASDTSSLDAVVQGVTALAGAFAAAQSAVALLGDENEELQQALLKVQASLGLLNGLQAIANALNKDSAFSLKFLTGARNADTAAIGAQSKATGVYGVALRAVSGIARATGLSMAASWAVATLGISVLITGIVALIANWEKLFGTVETSTQRVERLRKELEKQIEVGEVNNKTIDEYTQALVKAGQENNVLEQATKEANDELDRQKRVLEEIATFGREKISTGEIFELIKTGGDLSRVSITELNDAMSELRTQTENFTTDQLNAQASQKSLNEGLTFGAKTAEDYNKILSDEKELFVASNEEREKAIGILDKIIKQRASETSTNEQRVKQAEDLRESLVKLRQELELQALPDNQRELAELDIKYKAFKDKAQGNAEVLLAIDREYVRERQLILSRQSIDIVERQYKAETDAANSFYQSLIEQEKQRFVNKEISHEQLNINIQNLEEDNVNELIRIDSKYEGETATIDKQITENRRKQLDQQVQDTIEAERRKVEILQEEVNAYENFYQDSSQFFGIRLLALDKALKSEQDLLEEQRRQGIISEQEYQDALTDLTSEGAQARMEIAAEGLKQVLDVINNLLSESLQREFEALEQSQQLEVDTLEAKQQDKIDLLESQNARGLLSETQYQTQLSNLRKQQAAQDKALAQKQDAEKKALQIKSAQQQKALAIFQATIDAASAVMRIQATIPAPANIPFIAASVVLSAAKIAAIVAAPLPKFYEGTTKVKRERGEPVGRDTIPALLNEGERVVDTARNIRLKGITNEELVKIVEKHFVTERSSMPLTATVKELLTYKFTPEERLDIPTPNIFVTPSQSISTPQINLPESIIHAPVLQTFKMRDELLIPNQSETKVEVPEIDYKKLGKEVAQAIKKNPSYRISIDEKGFSEKVIEGNLEITLKNKRRKG